MSNIDRRAFFRRLGLGVVALGPVGSLAGMAGSKSSAGLSDGGILDASFAPATCPGLEAEQLLAPLSTGSTVATSTLREIKAYPHHVVLSLVSDKGEGYDIEICGRDAGFGAPRPVTRTERFELFVANGGKGDKWTARDHGLAAYAVADVLSKNEKQAGSVELRTLRDVKARI